MVMVYEWRAQTAIATAVSADWRPPRLRVVWPRMPVAPLWPARNARMMTGAALPGGLILAARLPDYCAED